VFAVIGAVIFFFGFLPAGVCALVEEKVKANVINSKTVLKRKFFDFILFIFCFGKSSSNTKSFPNKRCYQIIAKLLPPFHIHTSFFFAVLGNNKLIRKTQKLNMI